MGLRSARKIVPHPTDATASLVVLTKGYYAVISAADAEAVGKFNWQVHTGERDKLYATHRFPDGHVEWLHRFVGALAGLKLEAQVDHVNGNGLDCRRCNLRDASEAQNAWNARLRSDSRSGIKGVRYNARLNKWEGRIRVNGMRRYVGWYQTLGQAEEAMLRARLAAHGEFANRGFN